MNGQHKNTSAELVAKIAALIEEHGWNQEEFVRQSGLNRQTVRLILQRRLDRRLHNSTVRRCANALGLTVSELKELSLERLTLRMRDRARNALPAHPYQSENLASQPELVAWMERNPERARQLTAAEMDELLSLQGTGGPLTAIGVEHFVSSIERKRDLIEQIHAIAGTEYLELLEQFVGLLYEKVQPYRRPNATN